MKTKLIDVMLRVNKECGGTDGSKCERCWANCDFFPVRGKARCMLGIMDIFWSTLNRLDLYTGNHTWRKVRQ